MEQPWVLVAATVVSEMKDRLSPKKAPPMTTAVTRGTPTPVSAAMPAAMGTRATIVPTLVPMAIEMKQAARKIPAKMSFPGRIRSVAFTVASMAPMSFAVAANAPASTKIQIIRSTFLFPAPTEKMEILSSVFFTLCVMSMAYADAMMNAAATGTL